MTLEITALDGHPETLTCTPLTRAIRAAALESLNAAQGDLLVDYNNISDAAMSSPVMQQLLAEVVELRAKTGSDARWSREDLQRVLFHIICTYEQAINELGGDSEFMRDAVFNVGKNTLLDNGWWPEDKDRYPEFGLPPVRGKRRRRWGRR